MQVKTSLAQNLAALHINCVFCFIAFSKMQLPLNWRKMLTGFPNVLPIVHHLSVRLAMPLGLFESLLQPSCQLSSLAVAFLPVLPEGASDELMRSPV